MWIYNLGLVLYVWAIALASPWHRKAKLWIDGRKGLFRRMKESIDPSARIIWIHAASLGEFEQGRPLIEKIRKEHPEYKILLTFFSPSGYEIRKNYDQADYIFYLPIDTPRKARRFLDIAHPEIAIFVKYEFWINLPTELRRRVGMVFQKANPFPMSIYDNITYGPKLHGVKNKAELDELVESSLRGAALWDEVKDRLKKSALGLSGGQQQRLCIARALAVKPEVLLMDEPTSALDPGSTMKVEELMSELKKNYTVVIVTHNMQQAARVSDNTAFFYMGQMVEFGDTRKIFTNPDKVETQNYITGRFG